MAIKTTPRLNLSYRPTVLEYEAKIHALIPNGTEGFPSVHYAGPDANDYVIVMDRLGPTLNDLHRVCRRIFTLPTICMLADQMVRLTFMHIPSYLCNSMSHSMRRPQQLDRVQFLHSRGVVSCDVKPHNFAMGLGNNMDIVHMFDYSSARPYLCLPDMSEHIPFSSTGRHVIGTVRYASLAAHKSHCTCIHIVRHRVSHIAHVQPSDSCLPRRRYRVPPLRSPRVLPRPSPVAGYTRAIVNEA